MRADRLLTLLMLLQARGKMTAQELATELEVSVRTIYRDVEALSFAGVPIYTERGPGGGCALLDHYRTTLTGLTEAEIQALFMLSIPAPLTELGVGKALRGAMLKLSAALPETRRAEEARARQRFHLDATDWAQADQAEAPSPHLTTLYQAIWRDRAVEITHRLPFDALAQHVVAPYGLVAKMNVWYLIAAREKELEEIEEAKAPPDVHVYRVSQIQRARMLDASISRPPDFDLTAFWETWCAARKSDRATYIVRARVAPDLLPHLPYHFGEAIRATIAAAGPPDAEGWLTLNLPFENFQAARTRLLSFGGAVEALAPHPLRYSIQDFAAQIVGIYEGGEKEDPDL